MQTVDIILQFTKTIESNPAFLYQIPWDDLKLCISIELDSRKELYPYEQLQFVRQLMEEKFATLDTYLTIPDFTAIINILEELAFALQLLPNAEFTDSILAQSRFSDACLNHYKNDTTIVLGDSHVNFFSGNEALTFQSIGNDINLCPTITNNPFTVLHLGPCLAYNSNRTNTSTLFSEKVDYLCRNFIKPGARIICCLGEIDLRVHVFRQTELQAKSFEDVVDDIVAEYISFLASLKTKGYQVYCWGAIASQQELCPIDPDFPRNGTELQRNKATAYFNRKLSLLCEQYKIGYLSIFEQLIDSDFQTLEKYLSADHCHLGQRALELAQPLWDKMLFS